MGEERIPLPRLEGYDCFGCGTNNPIGLRMTFYRQGDAVCSDVVLKRDHVGWQNMAHGGIISTLLDEVMAWTVIYLNRRGVCGGHLPNIRCPPRRRWESAGHG
jgi:hypothetical protein